MRVIASFLSPHPCPLPEGEGESTPVRPVFERIEYVQRGICSPFSPSRNDAIGSDGFLLGVAPIASRERFLQSNSGPPVGEPFQLHCSRLSTTQVAGNSQLRERTTASFRLRERAGVRGRWAAEKRFVENSGRSFHLVQSVQEFDKPHGYIHIGSHETNENSRFVFAYARPCCLRRHYLQDPCQGH